MVPIFSHVCKLERKKKKYFVSIIRKYLLNDGVAGERFRRIRWFQHFYMCVNWNEKKIYFILIFLKYICTRIHANT